MAENYLITGYWGEPHVTAENDRGIHAAMFGTGRLVLPVGQQFRAEYIGNNTIRMYDGKLMDNGAAAGIPVGEYVDLLISNAGQGMKRNDLIIFQYSQDASTLVESGTFTVVQGEETSGTASDPVLEQQDLLSGEAALDQMALWRVSVSGATISAPVQLFTVYHPNDARGNKVTNVANGTASTDAVNLGQMNTAISTAVPVSVGIRREFTSGNIARTKYTTPGSLSKIYTLTIQPEIGFPTTVVCDWQDVYDRNSVGTAAEYNIPIWEGINTPACVNLTATLNANQTITFEVASGAIAHVCGYY